jgi:hypothetical protein
MAAARRGVDWTSRCARCTDNAARGSTVLYRASPVPRFALGVWCITDEDRRQDRLDPGWKNTNATNTNTVFDAARCVINAVIRVES